MATRLNEKGESHAKSLIESGRINFENSWSFSAEDGDELLGVDDDKDWDAYGRVHLAVDDAADMQTKEHFKYPFAKFTDGQVKVYRSGLVAIKQRAGQQGDDEILEAAGRLLDMVDEQQPENDENRDAPSYIYRKAEFKPETYNEEKRTIDVVFSSGARVRRQATFFGMAMGDPWFEELSLKRKHVRLDRLNRGASVLNAHKAEDLRDVLGVVQRARLEGDEGIATLRFSKRAEIQDLISDIRDGIIRNISVGYMVHRFEEQDPVVEGEGESKREFRVYRATDWEPAEISFVPVPADSGAQVRSEAGVTPRNLPPCTIIHRTKQEELMEPKTPPAPGPQASTVDAERVAQEATSAERSRVTEIQTSCRSLGVSDEFAQKLVADGTKLDDARKLIIAERAEHDKKMATNSPRVEIVRAEADTIARGIENALLHRGKNPEKNPLTEEGKMFRGMRLSRMLEKCLNIRGVNTDMMDIMTQWARAVELHRWARYEQLSQRSGGVMVTADFPNIMANVLNKTLRDAYTALPVTWAHLVRKTTAPDFKEIARDQFGDAPVLELLPEGSEIKYGKIGDSKEVYRLATYAKGVRVSRQSIVNDDLSAFTRLPQMFGARAAEKEADLVYLVLLANAALSDGIALFHASHNNLSLGGAAAIDVASVSAARAGMMTQKGLDGARITLTPAWLTVAPEKLTIAQQFARQDTVPTKDSDTNPFKGLQVASDPRLSDATFHASASATAWYLSAGIEQTDIIEMAHLEGREGPVIEQDDMFEVDGMKIKASLDVAAKALEFRGLQKNAGL